MTTHRSPCPPFAGRFRRKPAASSRLHSLLTLQPGGPHLLQLREFVLAKLLPAQRIVPDIVMFEPAQLYAADFSGNRLRQLRNQLDLADALERRQPRMQMPEDRQCGL